MRDSLESIGKRKEEGSTDIVELKPDMDQK
jgi:hypothetical protein